MREDAEPSVKYASNMPVKATKNLLLRHILAHFSKTERRMSSKIMYIMHNFGFGFELFFNVRAGL